MISTDNRALTRVVWRLLVRAISLAAAAAALQACSTSREQGDGGSLWSNDKKPSSEQTAKRPSNFDQDGPPTRETVYRGGRDPVTGRATTDWPPAAPTPVAQSTLPPANPYYPPPPPTYSPPNGYAPSPYAVAPAPSQPAFQRQPQPQYATPRPYPEGTVPAPMGVGVPISVEVRQGDTLYRIAKANNVTVPALMQANGLASESIKIGQRLTIPVP